MMTSKKRRDPIINPIVEAFSSNDSLLLNIFEEVPMGIFAKDWTGGKKYFFWNRKMEEIFGIQKDEVIGKTARSIFKDNTDREYIDRVDSLIVKSGKMLEVPLQKLHSFDQKIMIRMKKVPLIDEQTGRVVILGIVEDITSYKLSEQKLLQSYREREELEEIINRSPVVLFLFRGSTGYPVEFVSSNVWRFGYEEDFFSSGHGTLIDFIGKTNQKFFEEQMRKFSDEVPELNFELFSHTKNRWYEATMWPIKRTSLGEKLFQGIFTDITEKKRIEDELKETKKTAEAANEAKSRFLATITHELRTPLNGILGMTSLVLDSELAPEQAENLGIVKFSAESLLKLINDILDFSKIEADKLQLEWIPMNVKDLVHKVLGPLNAMAQEKDLPLVFDIHPDLDHLYLVDPVRLTQIINNLIGNALKFTSHGHVMLKAMPLELAPQKVLAYLKGQMNALYNASCFPVYFVVEDTGIGIPEDSLEAIFDAFSQSDLSTSRKFGGTGLGLSICKTLVEKFQGQVWVESIENVGSQFHFYVVLGRDHSGVAENDLVPDTEIEELAAKYMTSPLRILLAEDNPVNRLVTIKNVERLGWEIFTVENGKKALDAIKANEFDLVLMDIHMPVLDGMAAIKKIRTELSGEKSGIPVLAMTAMSAEDELESFSKAGFDGYILKPFKKKDLKSLVLKTIFHKKDTGGYR